MLQNRTYIKFIQCKHVRAGCRVICIFSAFQYGANTIEVVSIETIYIHFLLFNIVPQLRNIYECPVHECIAASILTINKLSKIRSLITSTSQLYSISPPSIFQIMFWNKASVYNNSF
jgi:hypothetical protein